MICKACKAVKPDRGLLSVSPALKESAVVCFVMVRTGVIIDKESESLEEPLIAVKRRDLTKKQKKEWKVSLFDNTSLVGKQLYCRRKGR